MLRRITRSGRSLVVTLAKEMLRALSWRRGDTVMLSVEGRQLIIRKLKASDEWKRAAAPPASSERER